MFVKEAVRSSYLSKSIMLHTSEGFSPLKGPANLKEWQIPFSRKGFSGKKGMSGTYPQLVKSIYHLRAQTWPRLICDSEKIRGKNPIQKMKLSIKDKSFLTSTDY